MITPERREWLTKRPPLKTHALIHLFALAHALVAIASRLLHYYDDVPLTVLTISMVVIISIRHRLPIEIAAITTLVASFVGFLVGVYGGLILQILLRNTLWSAALCTFTITELLGWGTYFMARSRSGGGVPVASSWQPASNHIILIAGIILLLRVGYMLILRHYYAEQESIYPELGRIFSNTFAILVLICGNLISVHLYVSRWHRLRNRWLHSLWVLSSLLIVTLLTTLCVQAGPRIHQGIPITAHAFFRTMMIVLLVCIAAYALLFLAYYVLYSQRELKSERKQRHLAQYQYSKFKQQINPHFLFNSLNILDSLVQEGERERAGTFIRKMAGLYRYMLRNEEETLVALRDELAFVDMYLDLIKERFTDGLEVQRTIPSEYLSQQVVPCSIQQLVENATKHNIVSAEEPLRLRFSIREGWLCVENNLQPRISQRRDSTHLGLKNITQQYLDIAGQSIIVEQTEEQFRVLLPLLNPTKE